MTHSTDDVRIREIKELRPPAHLLREFPCGDFAARIREAAGDQPVGHLIGKALLMYLEARDAALAGKHVGIAADPAPLEAEFTGF